MKKILRQGLNVSINELEKLIKELKKERRATEKMVGIRAGTIKSGFQINIINRQPKCSDTWEIEK